METREQIRIGGQLRVGKGRGCTQEAAGAGGPCW